MRELLHLALMNAYSVILAFTPEVQSIEWHGSNQIPSSPIKFHLRAQFLSTYICYKQENKRNAMGENISVSFSMYFILVSPCVNIHMGHASLSPSLSAFLSVSLHSCCQSGHMGLPWDGALPFSTSSWAPRRSLDSESQGVGSKYLC